MSTYVYNYDVTMDKICIQWFEYLHVNHINYTNCKFSSIWNHFIIVFNQTEIIDL